MSITKEYDQGEQRYVPDLLKALQIVTQRRLQVVGGNVLVDTSLALLLPVQEPQRDLELGRVLDDGKQTVNLLSGELTGTEN